MEKKGQITIFIILGIVIVSAILLFTLWIQPQYISKKGVRLGFEGCVEDAVEQAISELGESAGFINPRFTYSYRGEKMAYLCYTNEYYQTCTIQKPFLKQHLEEQMKIFLREQINTCYLNSIRDLKDRGFEVTEGDIDYEISIEPDFVKVNIKAPTSIRYGESGSRFVRFNVRVNSGIYEMIMITTSILQFESQLGDSDISSFMRLYPNVIIDKLKQGEGTTLYILENKLFKNKFKFASRSLVWPPGYDTR